VKPNASSAKTLYLAAGGTFGSTGPSRGTGERAALPLVLTDRERVLIGTGTAVTVVGMIVLAISADMNDTRAFPPSGSTLPSEPAPAAVATVRPVLATPALGATLQVGENSSLRSLGTEPGAPVRGHPSRASPHRGLPAVTTAQPG
jgi:hypothetical protein